MYLLTSQGTFTREILLEFLKLRVSENQTSDVRKSIQGSSGFIVYCGCLTMIEEDFELSYCLVL